jgi:hypothetical protein
MPDGHLGARQIKISKLENKITHTKIITIKDKKKHTKSKKTFAISELQVKRK